MHVSGGRSIYALEDLGSKNRQMRGQILYAGLAVRPHSVGIESLRVKGRRAENGPQNLWLYSRSTLLFFDRNFD